MKRSALCLLLLFACGDDAPSAPEPADAAVTLDEDFMGCPSAVPTLSLNMHASGKLITATVVDASRVPARRYLNDWSFTFTSAAGPVADIVVTDVRTFMPVHGHDGVVRPQVQATGEPGRFKISSLNFNMRGPWEVQLKLSSASLGMDYVVLSVCVAE